MTVHLSAADSTEIERRVTGGESRAKVGEAYGLLDNEVLLVVNRVRTARAARTSATPQPAPAASPMPQQAPASRTPAGVSAPDDAATPAVGSEPAPGKAATPAGSAVPSPIASRVGRLLTTGSPVGGPTVPQQPRVTDVAKYLDHADKRIAKAAAAAHKTLQTLGGLVFAWEAAETARREQEQRRTEAAEAVETLERQLAEARDALRATGAATKRPASVPRNGHAKQVRVWAAEHDVECAARGQIPTNVQAAYDAAHAQAAP